MRVSRIKNKKGIDFIPLQMLTDYNSLAIATGVKTNLLTYALYNRSSLQSKIYIKGRVVYKSEKTLRFVQRMLISIIEPLFNKLPGSEYAIAYKRGMSAIDSLKKIPHAKMLICFDIRHYFDNITLYKIEQSLSKLGLPIQGARLIGRYTVVENNGRHTLQQGSPLSPIISNVVGYYDFDVPIREYIASQNVNCTYIRYCDNIAIFLHENTEYNFYQTFKKFVIEHCAKKEFITHAWRCISDNNPVMNQKFIGVVLNSSLRVEDSIFNKLRGLLFNCCINGMYNNANLYFLCRGLNVSYSFSTSESLIISTFTDYLKSYVEYVNAVNSKQGLMLKKLLNAALYILEVNKSSARLSDEVFTAIKKYRNNEETVETYLNRIKEKFTS